MRTAILLSLALLALVPFAAGGGVPEPPQPQQQDVYIPAYQACLWKGSWKTVVDTPILRVWHYTCDDPDS